MLLCLYFYSLSIVSQSLKRKTKAFFVTNSKDTIKSFQLILINIIMNTTALISEIYGSSKIKSFAQSSLCRKQYV